MPLAKAKPISTTTTNIFKMGKPVEQLPLFWELFQFWRRLGQERDNHMDTQASEEGERERGALEQPFPIDLW